MYKVNIAFGNRDYYNISWQALIHVRVCNYFLVINGINFEIACYLALFHKLILQIQFAIDK